MIVMLLDRKKEAQYHQQPQQPVSALKAPPRSFYSPPTAMRYYRLWIYTCNAVLLVSVVGFSVVAAKILVFEPKRALVPGLSLTQPSFLYAYTALITQCGVLQFIGCLGARKLNERLLNIYWLLILLLLVGDGMLGVFWVYRFDRISDELRPVLKQRLLIEYGVDIEFTELWDKIQTGYKCCGVEGSQDFQQNVTATWGIAVTSTVDPFTTPFPVTLLPASCCLEAPPLAAALRNYHYVISTMPASTISTTSQPVTVGSQVAAGSVRCSSGSNYHTNGCEEKLQQWLRQTADILFVLGYCVISFLKLCFLGILRYEIREMIQKIKILQGELQAGLHFMEAVNKSPHIIRHDHNNGRLVMSDSPQALNSLAHRHSIAPPSNNLQNTPLHHLNTTAHQRHLSAVMSTDIDSDTNSHCALLIPEDPLRQGHNNNYALQEFMMKRHHNQM